MITVGVDYGKDDVNTECVCRVNEDGSFTVLAFNEWNHDIDLDAVPVSAQQLKWEGRLSKANGDKDE